MEYRLKCVFFGDRYVIQDDHKLQDFNKLIEFLIQKGIKPVIISNDGKFDRLALRQKLKSQYQELDWYISESDGTPPKPKKEAIKFILNDLNFTKYETIYVGNSDIDMKTAVNSNLLFLNAVWYGAKTDYGFTFKTHKEIAHFIDVFCLRNHLWAYKIKDENLEYYALGIYGTIEEKYNDYSFDAREAAKFGRGHPEFWIKYLLTSVYFSGLHENIDYIAPYPGHQQGSTSSMEEDTIITFSKCFRKTYLPDLIIRHTTATKSSFARYRKEILDHYNQINTIKINKSPLKDEKNNRYKQCPSKKGKTILVIDDFCTQGYSLEVARIYIEKTGAKVILLSLLKTIWKDYKKIVSIENLDPFRSNQITTRINVKNYSFWHYVIEKDADQEIRAKLRKYDHWNW